MAVTHCSTYEKAYILVEFMIKAVLVDDESRYINTQNLLPYLQTFQLQAGNNKLRAISLRVSAFFYYLQGVFHIFLAKRIEISG